MELTVATEPLRAKLREAQRARILPRHSEPELLDEAVAKHVLTADERDRLREALEARDQAIQVDDYAPRERTPSLAPPAGTLSAIPSRPPPLPANRPRHQ